MSIGRSSGGTADSGVMTDMVCTSCGCLCDDIELHIHGGEIKDAVNACPLGQAAFVGFREAEGPPCLIDGGPATLVEGIDRAAQILADARYPLILGLAETTSEAQRAAISLADSIGACVDVAGGSSSESSIEAVQSVGEVTCTLGEIRNRADLIIVWRADPCVSHPRLFSRHALEPTGTLVPGGRSDRYCVIIDVHETQSVREYADQLFLIREGGEVAALWILRALLRGIPLESGSVASETGVSLDLWRVLGERMRSARYGTLFYGVGNKPSSPLVAHGIHSLARDTNLHARFVCMPLAPAGGNGTGARNVLAWQTGYPGPVSLARGYPTYGPREFDADNVLMSGEADAALIVSGDTASSIGPEPLEALSHIHRIILTADGTQPPAGGAVVFRTAQLGIGTSGTVYRMDGVPLPVRTAVPSSWPAAFEILRAIEHRVKSLAVSVDAEKGMG